MRLILLLFCLCSVRGNIFAEDVSSFDSAAKKLILIKDGQNTEIINMGLTLDDTVEATECTDGDECYEFGDTKLIIQNDEHCRKINWITGNLKELRDCININSDHWYGGGQTFTQPWPIEKERRVKSAFVTSDMLQNHTWYGGASERYWISSSGLAVRVDDNIPLFLALINEDNDGSVEQMCFSSENAKPFSVPVGASLSLNYTICFGDDVRQVHENSYPKFYQYPEDIPDERMITHPIWSTWAEYKEFINDSRTMDLANKVKEYGFNNSQIEIDDDWETCYGNLEFNPERFPDPKGLVDELHTMGYRVTLWIHPFINDDCESYAIADKAGYFIKDADGNTQKGHWWQGESAGYIDFTNPEAAEWWLEKVRKIQRESGMDSFKFDAGETNWFPEIFTLSSDEAHWPNMFTREYVNDVAEFGKMIEVRVVHGTQQHPFFVRMLDKDSNWSEQNGLYTLIPSLLHSGIIGYPFCLPDMIGGNAYVQKPTSELFIRWAQANALMPSIQFSILPWNFGEDSDQVVEESKKATALHVDYASEIIKLAKESLSSVAPIARPTWWLCPKHEDCLMADQQFLLGDDVLVAPITEEGATTKEVIIPPGTWKRVDTEEEFSGPNKIVLQDMTIESNIYFLRSSVKEELKR